MSNHQMQVVKRNGTKEDVQLEKITLRIQKLTEGLNKQYIDWVKVAQKVFSGLYDGVTSAELDNLAAETAASLTSLHPDYSILAGRLAVTAHYKETEASFSATVEKMHKYIHPKTGESAGLIADDVYEIIMANKEVLDAAIDHSQDMYYEYFGFKTLHNAYLLKMFGKPVERIQHLIMRVSVGIWKDNIEEALRTYKIMSRRKMTHATPTLFNAGTRLNQLSSCFLLPAVEDSIVGMYKAAGDMATISKLSGGIGIPVSSVRATGAYVRGTNGTSNGIIPLIKVYNELGKHVNQGGKRKGSIAVYLEPWHADVFEFLELKKNHGAEDMRARDIFPALWVPDLFMERVEQDGDWSLMCPDEAPGLWNVYDDQVTGEKKFTELYTKYEREGRVRKTIKAVDLWLAMLESAAETGTPYMLYKDTANSKSNQKNLGTIKSSNLCLAGDTLVKVRYPVFILKDDGVTITKIINRYIEFTETLENVNLRMNMVTPEGHKVVFEHLEILSMNTETGLAEYKRITAAAMTNPKTKVLRITDEETGKSIECTPEHQVWTKNRGYVMAKDLKADDTLEIQ